MFVYPQFRLLVFTKVPELGKVKTRMQALYPAEFSLQLHTHLLDYFLSQCANTHVLPIDLWLSGSLDSFNQQFPIFSHINQYLQQGEDLGARMAFAIKSALNNKERLSEGFILVGTDCPFVNQAYLLQACETLKNHDVVVGPASDGGYVLLGLKKNSQTLFEEIHWGSEKVLEQTLSAIVKEGLSYYLLPTLDDIDRPEDLSKLENIPYFYDLLLGY